MLLEHYGDRMGFITGKVTSIAKREQTASEFQRNKLDVVVISGAGKQGINLHDITGKKRIHLIVADFEWSPTKFKQELGRVDRTGQLSSPLVTVYHSGSAGEIKFISTITNRMQGVGAVAKGGSESTGVGALVDDFELGTMSDRIALNVAWQQMPDEWKRLVLDHNFFDGTNKIKDGDTVVKMPKGTLDTSAKTFENFTKALQTIDMDTAGKMWAFYMEVRGKLLQTATSAEDEARKTAVNTGKILRQVDLAPGLRMSEVRNAENEKFAIIDGTLTPHMNTVKTLTTTLGTEESLGNGWMRWIRFYDPEKNTYVSGLRINPGKVKDVAAKFGQMLGSNHTKENALVDLRTGDRIKLHGANAAEWELYMGRGGLREGKIVIDYARMKDRETLGNAGAAYDARGNFFFVPEDKLDYFLNRFPIRNEVPKDPTLYQDAAPIAPDADPRMPTGGYEQAANWIPESEVRDEGWSQHVRPLLDEMQRVAADRLKSPRLDGAQRDLSPEGQRMLKRYLAQTKGEMATNKLATVRWGENQRDYAMFNYNRRYGFDKYLDTVYPYQFFYTRAMMRWAMQALDRPNWFANYARFRQKQQQYTNNLPERLRNKLRIPAPWLPEWMGDSLYIDPIGNLFPPAQFARPFQRAQMDKNYQIIEAERILQEWSDSGEVPNKDIQQAALTHTGATWERAFAEAQMRREAEMSSPMDFVSSFFGPAWYLSTPLNLAGIEVPGVAKGKPEKISNLPITNTARAIDTVTNDTWAEPFGNLLGLMAKPEEWARKKLDLPTLGEYGEYYTKRQLANMVTDGIITPEQAEQAMIEKQGALWDQATERVKMELSLRVPLAGTVYAGLHKGAGAAGQALLPSLFGSGLLPAGELEYRGIKDEWNQAWKSYDAGDTKAVQVFFDDHPEYEAYLAKGKDPADLLKTFLIGQVWDSYMALGNTNRKQVTSQLGDLFEMSFLDKETRSYDSIDVHTLAQWAQMLKAQVPNAKILSPETSAPAAAIDTYGPEVTTFTDKFFADRTRLYPHYYELEQGYYNLPKSARKRYLLENPTLKQYWDWKDKWYKAYPQFEPIFRGQAFKTVDMGTWPPALLQYVADYAMTGNELPKGAQQALLLQWVREGQPMGDVQTWLDATVVPAMKYQPGQ